MSNRWHCLMVRKRGLDQKDKDEVDLSPSEEMKLTENAQFFLPPIPFQDENDDDDSGESQDVMFRRASFQRNALRDLRVKQKDVFLVLKEAAQKAERLSLQSRRKKCLDELSRSQHEVSRRRHAIKIQSCVRGFICRQKTSKLADSSSTVAEKYRTHRRHSCSDVTNDWENLESDDFRHFECIAGNAVKRSSACGFNSVMTPETCPETEHEFCDSFSTIFTFESTDRPVRRPTRKLSPSRRRPAEKDQDASITNILHFSPPPKPKRGIDLGHHHSMPVMHPRTPEDRKRMMEMSQSSFSSIGSRDSPVKKPSRSSSPGRVGMNIPRTPIHSRRTLTTP